MRWRPIGWSLGAALLVAAAAVLVVTVQVEAGFRAASCGSAWDVIAGRAGWQQWWALDQADPVAGAARLRTTECVGAVNARVVTAAILAGGAIVVFAATALLGGRHSGGLRRLGMAMTLFGVACAAAGLVGIALLVADPNAPMFLYVARPVVVLLGFVLLLPAVLLIALGRVVGLAAGQLPLTGTRDEAP